MEIYIIDESDPARKGFKNFRNLSDIKSIDPLYICDMRRYEGKWLEDIGTFSNEIKEIKFIRLENDWVPERIRKKDFEDFLEKLNENDKKSLLEGYKEDFRYYILNEEVQQTSDDLLHKIRTKKRDGIKKKFIEILIKNCFDLYGTFFKALSMDAGMYYYCQPENHKDLKMHLNKLIMHHREIKKYDLLNKYSPFYVPLLNRMDYGVSLVNRERIILYANWRRRKLHGDGILGWHCFEVFPGDSPGRKCLNCPMDKVIEGTPEYSNKYRCEVHKLKQLPSPYDIYFVSETSSLYEIKEPGSNKRERWGINVVRDNTIRIITQEFQKVLQRVSGFRDIINLLKFALLGGTVDDFNKNFEKFFQKDTEYFRAIIEKISYQDTETSEKRILNFGFGRFRYYRNIIDIFNKNYSQALESGRHILQIYDAYDIHGRMTDFIGKFIDDNEGGKALINKLCSDQSGKLLDNRSNILAEIKNNNDSLNYAEKIGLLNKKDSTDLKEWYDIELLREDELLGYVSVDWTGKREPHKLMKYEILLGLWDFMGFVNQSILKVSDHTHLHLTADLKNIISKDYPTEDDMYFAFSERLCQSFKALKCEIYLFIGKDLIERKYLYYQGLKKESAEKINSNLPRTHRLGQHLTGNILDIILKSCMDNKEAKEKYEIYEKCVNVLNYDRYDEYHRKNSEKQVNKEYKEQEEVLISRYFKKSIKLKNCLIAPIIYKNEPVGAVKITNNLNDGLLYFPINDQRILDDVAGQLAIKIHNFNLLNRETKISKIFTELAGILKRSYGEIKDEQITDEIRREIFLNLKDIVNADEVLYYLVERDEDFLACLSRKIPECVDKENDAPEKISKSAATNFELGQVFIDLIERINPDNVDLMKSFFKNSGCKSILRRIDQDKKPYSVLFLNITDKKFDDADLDLIDTVTGQIEAVLTIRALKKQSMEIMDNISHQIISPLKGLETHCNNLSDNMLSVNDKNYFSYESDEKKQYVINLLKSQTFHVRFIAGNYRHYMNFASGKKPELEYTQINLTQIVIRIASIYQPIAKSQGLTNIKVSPENRAFHIICDELMLLHIFVCLIDNAIKYANKGKSINIDLNEDNEFYYIRVIDWGIPIAGDQWGKIFEREYRIPEARKRFKQGSGLGLYIVRQICQSIKASCRVEKSDMKTGETVFKVKLPKAIAATKK